LYVAAEGIVPVLGGCAGALVGGPEGGVVGVAVGQVVEKAINFFGHHIVQRWCAWFRTQPPEARAAALADLAALSPQEAHKEASLALELLAPDAKSEDKAVAVEYLSAIPRTLDRALLKDSATGARALPPTVSLEEPQLMLELLPTDLPPYPVPFDLPDSPYHLEQMIGSGGFGAVYRATSRSLQHLPFAIKFCLDRGLTAALHRERSNLERLKKAGGETWSNRIVRLYGYDLEHRTPYLVYEYVSGGDLIHHLARRKQQMGRALNAEEVLEVIIQVTEALAFAHQHGLVHRDLKPANILVDGQTLKLADFGLGGVVAARAAQVSRIGTATVDFLSVAEQASLFRGAGTPLYMSPEQRRGAQADPRHDLYSLGVMWYQLLIGDVSRELHPGWAKELAVKFQVPRSHIDLIERCVGWVEERPTNAGELLPLLRGLGQPAAAPAAAPVVAPPSAPVAQLVSGAGPVSTSSRLRHSLQVSLIRQADQAHRTLVEMEKTTGKWIGPAIGICLFIGLILGGVSTSLGTGVFFCFLAFGIAAAVMYFTNLRKKAEAQKSLVEAVQTLIGEFPEEVRSWGGATVLRNPHTVREIIDAIDPPPRDLESETSLQPTRVTLKGKDTPIPAAEREQRPLLREQVRQLVARHAEAARVPQPKPIPLWLGLILAVGVFAVPAGAAMHEVYRGYYSPLYIWGQHFDYRGEPLDRMDYQLKERTYEATAAALSVLVGVVMAVMVTWLLTRRPRYRWPLATVLAVSVLAFGLPAGGGVGSLYYHLYSPVESSGTYVDSRGNSLSRSDYELEDRKVMTTAHVIGIAVGVPVALMAAWIIMRRYRRSLAQRRQGVVDQIEELVKTFPATVQAWGGATALQKPATVQEILAALEAERT
jgi:serine/threonine protein kinase